MDGCTHSGGLAGRAWRSGCSASRAGAVPTPEDSALSTARCTRAVAPWSAGSCGGAASATDCAASESPPSCGSAVVGGAASPAVAAAGGVPAGSGWSAGAGGSSTAGKAGAAAAGMVTPRVARRAMACCASVARTASGARRMTAWNSRAAFAADPCSASSHAITQWASAESGRAASASRASARAPSNTRACLSARARRQ